MKKKTIITTLVFLAFYLFAAFWVLICVGRLFPETWGEGAIRLPSSDVILATLFFCFIGFILMLVIRIVLRKQNNRIINVCCLMMMEFCIIYMCFACSWGGVDDFVVSTSRQLM